MYLWEMATEAVLLPPQLQREMEQMGESVQENCGFALPHASGESC